MSVPPQQIGVYFAELEKEGKSLPLALAIGNDPYTSFCSQVKGSISAVDPIEQEERERDLDDASKLLEQAGVKGGTVIVHGDPARAIAQCAEETEADLVVIGTHGRGSVGRALRGSVSTALLHHAPCDVLVVR